MATNMYKPDLRIPLYRYKGELRRKIQHTHNTPIVLTIGDRWHDVESPNGAHWIKLPGDEYDGDGVYDSSIPDAPGD